MKKYVTPSLFLIALYSPVYAVETNQAAPPCSVTIPSLSKQVDLEKFSNKVVLIDFWATWCPPCLKSIPFFNNLYKHISHDQFQIIAINLDEDRETVDQYLLDHPINYPIAFDPNGECPQIYSVKAMPSSYLIDKRGMVRTVYLGYRDSDQEQIRVDIDKLLQE